MINLFLMSSKWIKYAAATVLMLFPASVIRAQFYSEGSEPGTLRWSEINTAAYRVIYPEGLDSLGIRYARLLEATAVPVSGSLGYTPNQSYRKPLPVVLHPYNCNSNGLVSWAPRRIELYTTPNFYEPDPYPWDVQLSIHESRHAAQMQPFAAGAVKPGRFLVGDFFPVLIGATCGGQSAMEGDAVLAETSLSNSGRGRTADFLEYQRACFSQDDLRDFWQWRYGSLKYYTPDFYRPGYMLISGLHHHYGMDKWPYPLLSMKIPRVFPRIAGSLAETWERDAAARAPFMPSRQFSAPERRFVQYTSIINARGCLVARRSGIQETSGIVIFSSDGSFERLKSSAYSVSRLNYNPADQKIYWSELRHDPRWEMKSHSVIRSLDIDTRKVSNLTRRGRYYNPASSEDGELLSVSTCDLEGRSSVMLLDSRTGRELYSYPAPYGIQVVETAWIGDNLYASVISPEGISIRFVSTWEPLTEPLPVKIKQLGAHDGRLVFVCDRTGVNELYSLDVTTREVLQLTNTEQGSADHAFKGDSLYFSYLSRDGRAIRCTALSDLPVRKVDFSDTYSYELADALSAVEPVRKWNTDTVTISEPKHYSRLSNGIRIHSWLPVYANLDVIDNISLDGVMTNCGVGATAYFQNTLSTFDGMVAYSAWTPERGWENAGHLRLSYKGLYPCIEGTFDISDSGALNTTITIDPENKSFHLSNTYLDKPFIQAGIRVYVPLNFSSGGWSRGVIPQIEWKTNSNTVDFLGDCLHNNALSFKLRAYSVKNIPQSCIYPRLGLGVEAGYNLRPGMGDLYVNSAFAYLYAYLPGFAKTHGIKLTTLVECHTGNGVMVNAATNAAPRGCLELGPEMSRYRTHGKATIDYALPFGSVDWSFLTPFIYVRNFELIAHYDQGFYRSLNNTNSFLSSAGADLVARLGCFAWIPFSSRIGITYCRNFGSLVEDRNYVGLVFSMDI